jgi:hypothetical protein
MSKQASDMVRLEYRAGPLVIKLTRQREQKIAGGALQ